MRTAARAAWTRRQQVSPSISSPSAGLDCSFSSALEAPRRREPDGVGVVQSVDFDDFIFRSQVQTFRDREADPGAENRVSVAQVRQRGVVAGELEVVPQHASAREQLEGTERQQTDEARSEALRLGCENVQSVARIDGPFEVHPIDLQRHEAIETPACENLLRVVAGLEIEARLIDVAQIVDAGREVAESYSEIEAVGIVVISERRCRCEHRRGEEYEYRTHD